MQHKNLLQFKIFYTDVSAASASFSISGGIGPQKELAPGPGPGLGPVPEPELGPGYTESLPVHYVENPKGCDGFSQPSH